MAKLQDAANMAQDPRLLPPLTAAVVETAVNVLTSEADDAENHENRARLARRVLMEPEVAARRFAWAVTTDDELVESWSDDEDTGDGLDALQSVVDVLWDAFADLPA